MAGQAAAPAPAEPKTTALSIISTPEQFQTTLATVERNYNVLTPFATIGGLAPQYVIFPSVVRINIDAAAAEVYDGKNGRGESKLQYLGPDEVALAKNGLRKIAEGLGISIRLEYLRDGVSPEHYYHVKAVAAYRGLDGQWVQREASEVWDLRDGSDRMRGWTVGQISEGRKHGLRQCEARAINAVIRECGCGVKQKYSRAELQKPFLAMRVNFIPNMDDPDQRRIVTERALQGSSTLFAQSQSQPSSPTGSVPFTDGEFIDSPAPVHVGGGATAAASGQSAAPAPTPPVDLPPCEGAVKIASAEPREFVYKNGAKTGQKGTKFVIVDSNGVEFSTFSKTHYDDAVRFKASNEWVEIATETNGQFTNIIEITKAGTEPHLPGLDEV